MDYVTRERVPILTAALTIGSLAVVFGAAGGVIPATLLPAAPEWLLTAIPSVNAAISAIAILAISGGWYWIRRGHVDRHRLAMVVSLVLFGTFLVLYLFRLVSLGGAPPFDGPETVYRYVYLPVLTVHVLLAMGCLPLLYYVLLLALTHTVGELSNTRHATVGRVAATLWLTSFGLGIVVYVLQHVRY